MGSLSLKILHERFRILHLSLICSTLLDFPQEIRAALKRPRSKGQHFEQRNVERPMFRNFEISNIKRTKDELFDFFSNFELIFLFLYLFQLFKQSKYMIIYKIKNLWNFEFFQIYKIKNLWNFKILVSEYSE